MDKIKNLQVTYEGRAVGKMALYRKHLAAFQYDEEWLSEGFSVSPFSLPLERKVFMPKILPFDGLFGVFADSLPDGWGRLLVDRLLLKNHIEPAEITSLERLTIVGKSGMGALQYAPEYDFEEKSQIGDLDEIAQECSRLLATNEAENLDELFRLGGSSGGARPKILTEVNGEPWIIKFPAAEDRDDIGVQEYEYARCAKACGIEMSDTKLFPSKRCGGYFGTRRFDRKKSEGGTEQRVHIISASGLLETSHRDLALDYNILMKACLKLTGDFREIEKLYRLMCFNVFAHNRDDHAKNFSFLYDEKEKLWKLAPAYDLTYSNSIGGEHATSVCGNGKNPSTEDLLAVAAQIGMDKGQAAHIAKDVQDCVMTYLKKYLG